MAKVALDQQVFVGHCADNSGYDRLAPDAYADTMFHFLPSMSYELHVFTKGLYL